MDIIGWIIYIGIGAGLFFLLTAGLIAIGIGGECETGQSDQTGQERN